MAWVKIDDQFPNHPKLRSVSSLGLALQTSAICYCGQYLTDGFLPAAAADQLIASLGLPISMGRLRWTPSVTSGKSGQNANALPWADIMVAAGLWKRTEGGFMVHDYLNYNPSKTEVLQRRAADKRRKGWRDSGRNPEGIETDSTDSRPRPRPRPPGEEIPCVGAEPPPPRVRGRAPKEPHAQAVIDAWFQAFTTKFGSPPTVNGAKAYTVAKTLLRGRTPEEALWLVGDFMTNPPDYYAEKNLFGLEHVLSAATQLLARRGEQPEPPRAWMSHEPRGR